ncbi:hypothetical protein BIY24_08160 [Halobacteriovorax marinus]|nr:hypothetical protein BIY24_08160 [Halobacteriovorax marinus]
MSHGKRDFKTRFTMNKRDQIIFSVVCLAIAFLTLRSDGSKNEERKLDTNKNEVKSLEKTSKGKKRAHFKVIEEKVAKKNDVLVSHSKLRSKAILNKKENELLDQYFTDHKNIRVAFLTLSSQKFDDLDKAIDRRINATNFLMDGLSRSHMDRSEIIKAAEMFLLSENEELTENLDIRRAIIGDKVDLYNALVNYAPEQVEIFKRNYMSERLKKVIQYVEMNKQRNRG